jgi:hypothetical protein
MSSPSDVAKLLQDALDTQPAVIHQPNNDNLIALKEKLLNVLQTINYNRADCVHYVIDVIQSGMTYKANHTGVSFPIPQHLVL